MHPRSSQLLHKAEAAELGACVVLIWNEPPPLTGQSSVEIAVRQNYGKLPVLVRRVEEDRPLVPERPVPIQVPPQTCRASFSASSQTILKSSPTPGRRRVDTGQRPRISVRFLLTIACSILQHTLLSLV